MKQNIKLKAFRVKIKTQKNIKAHVKFKLLQLPHFLVCLWGPSAKASVNTFEPLPIQLELQCSARSAANELFSQHFYNVFVFNYVIN